MVLDHSCAVRRARYARYPNDRTRGYETRRRHACEHAYVARLGTASMARLNMPYHAEHHYASSVPYHALPRLHALVSGDLPVERRGYVGAHADMLAQIMGRKVRADGRGI